MRCEQAQELFNPYLDGELVGSLATELAAHRVHCADCRRALALLEVTGQIVAADQTPVSLSADFGDRLLACVDLQPSPRSRSLRRGLYIAGPLAAAAVIGLALLGVLDGRPTKVAGEKTVNPFTPTVQDAVLTDQELAPSPAGGVEAALLEDWVERTRQNIAIKRQSGESLQQYLDMTILQWIDVLESAKDGSPPGDHFPGAEVPTTPSSLPAERPPQGSSAPDHGGF